MAVAAAMAILLALVDALAVSAEMVALPGAVWESEAAELRAQFLDSSRSPARA